MELDLDPTDLVEEFCGPSPSGEAPGVPQPPPRLSPSGASTFEQCPRRWRFRYVDRLPDPPGVPALAGTFAHRVLELLLQEPVGSRTKERAKELARGVWPEIEADEDFTALALDDAAEREFRWKTWIAIEGLWDLEDPETIEVHATEHDVEADLAGVPFRGIVDRIDVEPDGLVVTDYKSGRAPTARYAAGRLHQVLLYTAAVAETTNHVPVRARLLYLGQKIVDVAVTEAELEGAVEKLATTWDAIGEACTGDAFEPRTGPLCGWCPYTDRCDEGRGEVERRAARRRADEESLLRLAG